MKKAFSFSILILLIFSTEILHTLSATNYGEDLQKLIDDSNAALNDEEAAEFPITLDITSESNSEVVSDVEPVEEIEEAVEDEDASDIEESGDEILE